MRTVAQYDKWITKLESWLAVARKERAQALDLERYGVCDHDPSKHRHESCEVYGQTGYYDKGWYTVHNTVCACGKPIY